MLTNIHFRACNRLGIFAFMEGWMGYIFKWSKVPDWVDFWPFFVFVTALSGIVIFGLGLRILHRKFGR